MINYIDNADFLKYLPEDDFFALKIKCLFKSYGFTSYTEFFRQGNDAYIARLDDNFILYKTSGADDEEIRHFLKFCSVKSLLCADDFKSDFTNCSYGYVMKYRQKINIPESTYSFESFCELREAYELIKRSFDKEYSLPLSSNFLSGITHSLNKQAGIVSALSFKNRVIAFAYADICENGAVVSNVAVDKEYRKKHIGRDLLNNIINRIKDKQNIFLQRNINENKEFYNSLGFEDIYRFKKYTQK